MAPRSYSQDKRAASVAATKRRIRDAARALYREQGIRAATVSAVATRADVSRGTVLNHYGSADELLAAVMDEIVEEIQFPDERVQVGATSEPERIRRYVDAMLRFFVRSEEHWQAFSRDMDHPLYKSREADFYGVVGRLYGATFLDLAEDRIVGAAARALVNWPPFYDLRTAGLALEESIDLLATALIDLAARRRRELAMPIAD
jgi:AcrR family transcriptional regulator